MSEDNDEEFEFFCNLFLQRAKLDCQDFLMTGFFHDQIIEYLHQKNTQFLTAPEVDMICDLIEDTWNDLQEYIETAAVGAIANISNLLKTIHIDFPTVEKEPVLNSL